MHTSHSDGPLAWRRRLPVVLLASLGAALSTYLTLYQWHVLPSVWDPLFGSASSEAVLTAFLSRWLPLPDATLGAAAYLGEAALAVVGSRDRWRTEWTLVAVFGALVCGMAFVSLGLVLMQAFMVHAFCTLCLGSAVISWCNAWLSKDEVLAVVRQAANRSDTPRTRAVHSNRL